MIARSPSPTDAPLQTLESQLCFALYSVTNAVGRNYAPLLDAMGLTYSQYLAMLVLWEQDDISVGEIGRRLFLDSGTLTPLLKRLEAAGHVERRRNPADERQVRVCLTASGHGLREQARRLPREMACAMGRTGQEIAALRDDLLRLRSSLMTALDSHPRDGADTAS